MPYTAAQLRLIARYEQLRKLHDDRVAELGAAALAGEKYDELDAELRRLEESLPEDYSHVNDPH